MSERVSLDRHTVLRQLILEKEARTQEELCEALRQKKFDVTQSTVSRDLRRIGAIKSSSPDGQIIYHLPEEIAPQIRKVSHDVSALIVEIEANENMIVMHTAPGSASLVAAAIDSQRKALGILGTLSGDDTVFVAPASIKKINSILKNIKEEIL